MGTMAGGAMAKDGGGNLSVKKDERRRKHTGEEEEMIDGDIEQKEGERRWTR